MVGTRSRPHPPRKGAPAPARSAAHALYVYGIVRATRTLHCAAGGMVESCPVRTIVDQGLAAVVSAVPAATIEPTRANLLAHERVNAELLRGHTLIPMSFGTVFRSRADVVALLRSGHDAFHDVLEQMHDKFEMGLKVLRDRTSGGEPHEDCSADVLARLRDVCVASRCNPPLGDRMLLNAAFLVERRQEAAFGRRLEEIADDFDALTFQVSGPWPPYNFVTIRLKQEAAG